MEQISFTADSGRPDPTCLWCSPSGYCGALYSGSYQALVLCARSEGCGYESRSIHLFYKLGEMNIAGRARLDRRGWTMSDVFPNMAVREEILNFYRKAQACIANAEKNIRALQVTLDGLKKEKDRPQRINTNGGDIDSRIENVSRDLDFWIRARPIRDVDLRIAEGGVMHAAFAQMKVEVQGRVGDNIKDAFALNQMGWIPLLWDEFLRDMFGEAPGLEELRRRQEEIRAKVLGEL